MAPDPGNGGAGGRHADQRHRPRGAGHVDGLHHELGAPDDLEGVVGAGDARPWITDWPTTRTSTTTSRTTASPGTSRRASGTRPSASGGTATAWAASSSGAAVPSLAGHLWVCPFPEEDVGELIDAIGAGDVLFGSDYPHPEGPREPADFASRLAGRDAGVSRMVLRGNAAGLLGLADHARDEEGQLSRRQFT